MSVLCSGAQTGPALSAEKDMRKVKNVRAVRLDFIFQKRTKRLARNNQTTDN
jgi:hypothetical protein